MTRPPEPGASSMPCPTNTPLSATELELWVLLTDFEHREFVEREEWCSLESGHDGLHYANMPFDRIANASQEVLWLRWSDDGATRSIVTAGFCGEPRPGTDRGDPCCRNPRGHAAGHSWTYDPQGIY